MPPSGADFASKLADLEVRVTAIAEEANAQQTPGSAVHKIVAGFLSNARDRVRQARVHLERGVSL